MTARQHPKPHNCLACGVALVQRRSPNGHLEAASTFNKRRYCSEPCYRFGTSVVPPSLLVAKTCIGCCRLVLRDGFRVASGRRASRCRDCMNAAARGAGRDQKARAASQQRERNRRHREATRDAANAGRPWSEDEVSVLLDSDLSIAERARRLGRTYRAALSAIPAARDGSLIKAPRQVEIPHGTPEGSTYWCCRCDDCRAAAAVKARRTRATYQARTLPTAHRRGLVWTSAELEILATRVGPDDLTIAEVALLLGRSYSATNLRRQRVLNDPKWMKAAGVLAS